MRVRELRAPELGERVLLAVDTSIGTSVAVGVDGVVLEIAGDDPRGHAEVIGDMIAGALEGAGVEAGSVSGVIAGIGPGPFTGLRVGIVAARTFALGVGAPVYPLQGHEAVALQVLEQGAASGVRVVQDAKRRELFITEFSGLDWAGIPVRLVEPHLVPREGYEPVAYEVWPERIPAGDLVRLAARRLEGGRGFEPDQALYLRAPDVASPTAPKRVTP